MAIAKDLVSGILSGNIDTSATNIIVSIGEGLSSSQITGFFPPTPFHMTIMPKSPTIGVANSFDSEVVKVTAVAADQSGDASLTVVRGQYDTTAKSFDSGAIVTLGVYAEDAVFKSDDVLPPAEAWVGSDDIKANAVKASNIDFTTFSKIYDNEITSVGKTYTITTPGIYLAWGISANPSNGSVPTVSITMGGVIKAKSVNVSNGVWATATAIAVSLLNSGDTIVVSQESANTADNRSSVGMCLIQRVD